MQKNKIVTLSALSLLLLTVSQAYAANRNSSLSTNCDDDAKNHGAFVSCVAHEHEGGKTVSEAAHSEIGKKDHDQDDDDINSKITPTVSSSVSPGISPTETPTVTPTGTITPSPSETPSVTPTITPTVSPESEESTGNPGINNFIKALQDLIRSFISSFQS